MGNHAHARSSRSRRRYVLPAAAAAAVIVIAAGITVALSGGTPHHAAHHNKAARVVADPAFSYKDGAAVCNVLNLWITMAVNEDQPRLPTSWYVPNTATSDGFGRTQLGEDLATEAADLEEDNSLALDTDPLANNTQVSNTTALSADCVAYGVTLNWHPYP